MRTYKQLTSFGHFDTTVAPWGVFHADSVSKSLALSCFTYVKYLN